MAIDLGPRDEQRFAALEEEEREYLVFLVDFSLCILDRRPRHLEALQQAANALTGLGYYHFGLGLDRRLKQLRPQDATVAYNLACSLALIGRAEDALAELAEAVRLGYRDGEHMLTDPDLRALKHLPRLVELAELARKGSRSRGRKA